MYQTQDLETRAGQQKTHIRCSEGIREEASKWRVPEEEVICRSKRKRLSKRGRVKIGKVQLSGWGCGCNIGQHEKNHCTTSYNVVAYFVRAF